MKLALSAALALTLTVTHVAAQDAAPDAWVAQATCADVLQRLDNPMDNTGLSSPISGVAYLGAAIGFIEGYRTAQNAPVSAAVFKEDVFNSCTSTPQTPFKEIVEKIATDAS